MQLTRSLKLGALALGLAVVLFLTAAVVGTRGPTPQDTPPPTGRGGGASVAEVANTGDLTTAIAALQTRLKRLPADASSWSALGSAYIQQARVTGDPTYYAKAGGALRRSIVQQPQDNFAALTGQSALAAGRHDFGRALALARESQQINRYSAPNQGMLVDALVELGRYDAAAHEAQRMVNLKPGVPSYSRVSYIFELRGNLEGAVYAMSEALKVAFSPDDQAFALFQLGELAWNAGDLAEAQRYYDRGLQLVPSYVPLLYGKAKVEAAQGDTAQAIEDFQTVVDRYPSLGYLVEYVDLLKSLGDDAAAAQQQELITAQQEIFRAAGVNLDLELALYDATYGNPREALVAAAKVHSERKSIFVEDAYAWALHANGRDRQALDHARHAARLGTESALLAFHRGMIEKSLGLEAEAKTSLKRALDINPYFSPIFVPDARQALIELRGGQ